MKMQRREFFFKGLAAVGTAGVFGNSTVGFAQKKPMRLRKLSSNFIRDLPRMMQLANVPGLAVAYVENSQLAWRLDLGVQNAGTREPVTADTVWQVGSLSKPVFACLVLSLVEAGKLDLDRPLAEYISGDLVKNDPRAKAITARHALSHTTGLQNWRFQAGQELQLGFTPGERWSYSGEGIYYLQRAIEEITKKGLAQLADEYVLTRLKMSSSSYAWRPDYTKRLATAHNAQGAASPDYLVSNIDRLQQLAEEWKKPLSEWRHEDQERAQTAIETRFPPVPTFFSINSAGSLITTTADYAKFVASLLNSSPTVLNARSRAEFLKPQTRINDTVSWGLGTGLQTAGRDVTFWHWGEGINYRTFYIADPVAKTAVVIFTNGRNGRKIWERVVTEATGVYQPLLFWL